MHTDLQSHSIRVTPSRFYPWMACLVAALGRLMFGYDWVVISGADMVGVFMQAMLPETKGKTLEEIERELAAWPQP